MLKFTAIEVNFPQMPAYHNRINKNNRYGGKSVEMPPLPRKQPFSIEIHHIKKDNEKVISFWNFTFDNLFL